MARGVTTSHALMWLLLAASAALGRPARGEAAAPQTTAVDAPTQASASAEGFVLRSADGAWRLRDTPTAPPPRTEAEDV